MLRRTPFAIRELGQALGLAGFAATRRLSRNQSRYGLAVCRGARNARAEPPGCGLVIGTDCPRSWVGDWAGSTTGRPDSDHPSRNQSEDLDCCEFSLLWASYRLWRNRHPRWGGMQVGFRDLTIWSFLMASAHGAGLMVLPLLLKISPGESSLSLPSNHHHLHNHSLEGPLTGLLATGVHTLGYLVVTGLVALLVYEKFGLALLRNAWLNLDLVWAVALMITGCLTLLI